MKKVLSVAMASAMVLGMGANAFAIQYSTGSNDTASWPKGFQFDGELFVTDKDGKIVKEASTALNESQAVNFQPGDVIWMPLYAKDQKTYVSGVTEGNKGTAAKEEHIGLTFATVDAEYFLWKNGDKFYGNAEGYVPSDREIEVKDGVAEGRLMKETEEVKVVNGKTYVKYQGYVVNETEINNVLKAASKATNRRYYIGATQYKNVAEWAAAITLKNADAAFVTETNAAVEGTDTTYGKPIWDENAGLAYGNYTGNIDKNWSINLIEKDGTVSDLIEKAELYKADKIDYHSYKDVTDEIVPNGVYLKVTLKDSWKTVSSETLKYYVYIANNKNNGDVTNKVWVSGKYAPAYRTVDFTWSNNANTATLWKAEENGTAVFDFADKVFFTVKMYKGETMYLDLKTAYDKAIDGDMDGLADSFYKFDKTNANFARAGELVIVTDDDTLVPYEIDEDGNFVELDADYVTNYTIKNINKKVNGFRFDTKQLGNYVLSTEELGAEEEPEEPAEEPSEEPAPEVKPDNTGKQNPNTGAEDFVGLAVSLAVVSVAAAGALALKK